MPDVSLHIERLIPRIENRKLSITQQIKQNINHHLRQKAVPFSSFVLEFRPTN